MNEYKIKLIQIRFITISYCLSSKFLHLIHETVLENLYYYSIKTNNIFKNLRLLLLI